MFDQQCLPPLHITSTLTRAQVEHRFNFALFYIRVNHGSKHVLVKNDLYKTLSLNTLHKENWRKSMRESVVVVVVWKRI